MSVAFPEILMIDHAAPARLVPKGGRLERTILVGTRTPVRPVVLPEGSMRPYGIPPGHAPMNLSGLAGEDKEAVPYEHGGRLWERVVHGRERGYRHPVRWRTPVGTAALTEWFDAGSRGDDYPHWALDWNTLTRRAHCSPLSGPGREGRLPWRGTTSGDLPLHGGLPPGTLVEDCTDDARLALLRAFDRDVRVCGDDVFLAWEGVHACVIPTALPGRETYPLHEATTAPRHAIGHLMPEGYVVRHDRPCMRGFVERMAGLPTELVHLDWHPLASASDRDVGDTDVALMAQELPGRLLRWASRDRHVDIDGLAPLLPLAARGAVGAIPPEDEDYSLRTCARIAETAWGESPSPTRRSLARDLAMYVREVALPVVDARSAPEAEPDDDEALRGLAP